MPTILKPDESRLKNIRFTELVSKRRRKDRLKVRNPETKGDPLRPAVEVCTYRNCEKRAAFLIIWEHPHRGGTKKATARLRCLHHARSFAKRHSVQLP